MDISNLDLSASKAAAYDQLVIIENAQKNLKVINDHIFNLQNTPATPDEQVAPTE